LRRTTTFETLAIIEKLFTIFALFSDIWWKYSICNQAQTFLRRQLT